MVCSEFATESEADAHCAAAPDPNLCVKHAPEGSGLHFETTRSVASCAGLGMQNVGTSTASYNNWDTSCQNAATYLGLTYSTIYVSGSGFPPSRCRRSYSQMQQLGNGAGTQGDCRSLSGSDQCVCVKELNPNWKGCICRLYPPPSPLLPPSPPPPACLPGTVAVTVVNQKYYFDGVEATSYGVGPNTYTFTGVPSGHKMAWMGSPASTDWYNAPGNNNGYSVQVISSMTRRFRYGDAQLVVSGSFSPSYFRCYTHGDMNGAAEMIKYDPSCTV